MNELDLINKTSEFARIYGIEFYHVRENELSSRRVLRPATIFSNFRFCRVALNIVLSRC